MVNDSGTLLDYEPVKKKPQKGWAIAAVIALSFLLLAQFLNQPWTDKNRQEVARFGKIENCRWTNQEKIPLSGDPVIEGQRIEISSGKVELLYHNGARIELTGPCIIETISEKETFLTMGTVDVVADSPESQGFMVRSPTSTFEDLGTAFSASVAPDGLEPTGGIGRGGKPDRGTGPPAPVTSGWANHAGGTGRAKDSHPDRIGG